MSTKQMSLIERLYKANFDRQRELDQVNDPEGSPEALNEHIKWLSDMVAKDCERKNELGAEEYGVTGFLAKTDDELLEEVYEEALDLVNWSKYVALGTASRLLTIKSSLALLNEADDCLTEELKKVTEKINGK